MLRWRLGDALDETQMTDEAAMVRVRAAIRPPAQSTGAPSATGAAAIHERAIVSLLNVHLLCQPNQGPRHGHPGRVGTGLAVCRGNLRVTLLQLHARDDHFALLRTQALQRRFVSIHGLVADRFVERRRGRVRMLRLVVQSPPASGSA